MSQQRPDDAAPEPSPAEGTQPAAPSGADVAQPVAPSSGADLPASEAGEQPVAPYVAVRRAPRYRAFVWVGLLVGVVLAIVAVLVAPTPRPSSLGLVLLFITVAGAGIGAGLGALVAVLLDRRAAARFDRDRR